MGGDRDGLVRRQSICTEEPSATNEQTSVDPSVIKPLTLEERAVAMLKELRLSLFFRGDQ